LKKNSPDHHKRFTSLSVKCLWCHSVTNNTALFHPDHCAPIQAVKSGIYQRDQMVCSYRHSNGRHKPGHFFDEKNHKSSHDDHHKKQDHHDDKKPRHHQDKPEGHHDKHQQNKWPAPPVVPHHGKPDSNWPGFPGKQWPGQQHGQHNWQPHGGKQQPHTPWKPNFDKGGEWKQFWRHNGPPGKWNKPNQGRPFPKAGQWNRKLLAALNVEDPYSGDTTDSPISDLPPALQFLAGLALGLLGETPSAVVMCGADVADVIEDVEDAFKDFHLSVSGIVSTLTDLFNAVKAFSEVLENCGLEDVLEKITAFISKYSTPVIGEILGAITITFNAIDVYDDIDDAVHSSESGDWFDVGKDIGDVIGIVA